MDEKSMSESNRKFNAEKKPNLKETVNSSSLSDNAIVERLQLLDRNVANKSNEKEMIGGCVVCGQDEGYLDNVLIYCDGEGCGIGVHEGWFIFVKTKTI